MSTEIIVAFLSSIYFPSILIYILSLVPFWINYADSDFNDCMTSEKGSMKKELSDMSKELSSGKESIADEIFIEEVPRKLVYKSRRFKLSFIAFILMIIFCLFCTVTKLLSVKHCFLNYIWITFMIIMNIIQFHHICKMETGEMSGGKKSKILYPLIFLIFNVVYWPLSFICTMKNINFC